MRYLAKLLVVLYAAAGAHTKMDGETLQFSIARWQDASVWTARALDSFSSVERNQWDYLFGETHCGYDYFRACELCGQTDFKLFAFGVFSDGRLIAGVPAFTTVIPLHMLLEGKARTYAEKAYAKFPKALSAPILGLGSPYWQELAIVFDPDLPAQGKREAIAHILAACDDYAKTHRIPTLIAKDATQSDRTLLGPAFSASGYCAIQTLPLTSLPVAPTDDEYIASLSANMRSNMRRKLKKAKGLRMEIRTKIDAALEDELHRMRSATISRAKIDFEAFSQVPRGYYRAVLEQMAGRSYLRLYWFEDKLIGFTLIICSQRTITETYTGMLYPDGPDHGLFFRNWMVHMADARKRGMSMIDTGPTTYIAKERLNCHFHRTWLFVRDRKRLVNWALHRMAPTLGFHNTDLDLKQLGDLAPYVD